MFSRRAELNLGRDPLGEVLAIGVLPHTSPRNSCAGPGSASDELVAHAAPTSGGGGRPNADWSSEAHNKPALLFYHRLGGRFEPYEHAGERCARVFDLQARRRAEEVEAPLPGGAAR